MTQQQDDPPTADGPAAEKISSPADGAAQVEPESDPKPEPEPNFTLAGPGPGPDPAVPAVQPVTAPVTPPPADYDKYGVPTLDFVRNKIEARYAASLGAEELARETAEAKSFEQREEDRAKAAEAALEKIRQSLRDHRQS